MKAVLLIFLGGGLGSVLRYGTVIGLSRLGAASPWGVFTANMLGSFVLGALCAVPGLRGSASPLWWFLATGMLGGYTTFSTWSADTLLMMQEGRTLAALVNMIGSALAGLLCAAAGFALFRPTAS
jgi:fluoride exporter